MITLESLDVKSLFLVCDTTSGIRGKFVYEGYQVKVEVTAAKNVSMYPVRTLILNVLTWNVHFRFLVHHQHI